MSYTELKTLENFNTINLSCACNMCVHQKLTKLMRQPITYVELN